MEFQTFKNGEKAALNVELKPTASRLRYTFLSPNKTFSIILSAKLDDTQLGKLLNVLRKHRGVMKCISDDIKEISRSVHMY